MDIDSKYSKFLMTWKMTDEEVNESGSKGIIRINMPKDWFFSRNGFEAK
jgi:hypothetical protein